MPMSVVGGHKGSYRKVNPQLRQFTTSLDIICQSLNRAPDNWWTLSGVNNTEFENPLSEMENFAMHLPGMGQLPMDMNPTDRVYYDDNDDDEDHENDDELIDLQQDEMIDLQPDE
jgi:hypothetical protein